jgi:AAA+ superfamily predicted ATPase
MPPVEAAVNASHGIAEIDALSPAQAETYGRLQEAIAASPLVVLEADAGFGKSTLVKRLLKHSTGAQVPLRDLLRATAHSRHAGMESQLAALLDDAFARAELVVVDDFDLIAATFSSSGYVRRNLAAAHFHSVLEHALEADKTLLVTGADFRKWFLPERMSFGFLEGRMLHVVAERFTEADYRYFIGLEVGANAARTLPSKRLFDYSPGLNGHQLRRLGALMADHGRTDEAFAREMIDTRLLVTNANLGEISDVKFSDLKGFEQIVADLTTYVINPLKADPRFDEIGLAPKRGVLLYGPPGTGKTSVGRALAHQMQGKFFMIDGTIPTEPAKDFYAKVQAVFHAAKKAAPCVLFIDDADVLFQSDRSTGLSRYLLTMLDGLESETSGKVAVIMTAMDPNHMPPALLRSGRVELWLETRPPPDAVRAEIIAADVARLPAAFRDYDFSKLRDVTAGFNAADMRRIVSDVKALYARDVVEGRPIAPADAYFATAAAEVLHNKVLLGLAESGKLMLGAQPGKTSPAGSPSDPGADARAKRRRIRDESNQCTAE